MLSIEIETTFSLSINTAFPVAEDCPLFIWIEPPTGPCISPSIVIVTDKVVLTFIGEPPYEFGTESANTLTTKLSPGPAVGFVHTDI